MRAINISKSHVGTWTTRNANEKSVINYAIMTGNLNDRIIESETDENNTLNIRGKQPTDHRAITMTIQMKRAPNQKSSTFGRKATQKNGRNTTQRCAKSGKRQKIRDMIRYIAQ